MKPETRILATRFDLTNAVRPVVLGLVLVWFVSPVRAQTTQPAASSGTRVTAQPTTAPAAQSQPAGSARSRKLPYTTPGIAFRGPTGVVVATAVSASLGQTGSMGREASEANVGAGRSLTGVSGLAAPQAFSTNTVVGQPGLQRGLAAGFGPLPRQNIFTRSINPISGANGACAILGNAGFTTANFCGIKK